MCLPTACIRGLHKFCTFEDLTTLTATKPCSKQWLLSYKLLLSLKKVIVQTGLLSAYIRVGHSLLGMNVCLQVWGGWPSHPGPGRGTLVLKAERQRWLFPGLWRTTPCYCRGSVLLDSFLYLLFNGRKRVLRVWIRKRLDAWSPQPDLCSDHCWLPGPCHLCLMWKSNWWASMHSAVKMASPGLHLWGQDGSGTQAVAGSEPEGEIPPPPLHPSPCVPCAAWFISRILFRSRVPLLSALQPGLDLHAERGLKLMRPLGPSPHLLHPQIQEAQKSAGIKSACRWCIRKLTCHLLGTLLTSQQREAYFGRKWEECPALTTSLSLVHGHPSWKHSHWSSKSSEAPALCLK